MAGMTWQQECETTGSIVSRCIFLTMESGNRESECWCSASHLLCSPINLVVTFSHVVVGPGLVEVSSFCYVGPGIGFWRVARLGGKHPLIRLLSRSFLFDGTWN